MVDDDTADRQMPEDGYIISSPCEPLEIFTRSKA